MEFEDILKFVEDNKKQYLEEYLEDHELIVCSECGEEKHVEKGTWALDKGMCEPCYCIYQGG